jgi:hypothetical protein
MGARVPFGCRHYNRLAGRQRGDHQTTANEAEGTGAHSHRRRIAGERTLRDLKNNQKASPGYSTRPTTHGCTSVEQPTERFAADIEEPKQ